MRIEVVDPYNAASDPAMPSLAAALDPAAVEHQFNRRLHSLKGDDGRIVLRSIAVTRHKPQRRCVVEYGVTVERGGEPEDLVLIGKVRVRRFGKSGFRRLRTLWDAGFQDNSPDGISVPEPVGTVSDFRMWLQRKVPGTVATDLMNGRQATTVAKKISEAAHKIHQTEIPVEARHSIEDEVQILRERLPAVWENRPHLRSRIETILDACTRLAATVPTSAPRVIHRDFYADQVIVDGDRLYLIDFDLCCLGDTALDIGNFVGHITEHSLRTFGDPESLLPVEQALVDRFVQLSGEQIRPVVDIYATLTLVRHIHLSTLFPDRQEFTDRIIDLCQSRIDQQRTADSAS